MKKHSVVSLFTGAGGLDLGFHEENFRTLVAVEMDRHCCNTLRENKSRARPWAIIEQPVEDVPSHEILTKAKLDVGELDVLIGGPPCQPFSKSGYWARGDSGRLKDPRANTLSEYIRVVRDLQPTVFLIENVSGLAYTGKEEGFQFILDEVRKVNKATGHNYQIEHKVLNAAWYGVPQTRERIFLVAHREGKAFTFPEPRFASDDDDNPRKLPAFRNAWDALGDLDEPANAEETRLRGYWADLLKTIPEGANYLHHTDRGEGQPLFGWRRRYWSFLLKLAKARPSWTITAQPGPAIGPFHWNNRRLSRQELARIQTFPDDYVVTGSLADAQRQIGNAVPSLLAQVLAREIRTQLLGDKAPSTEPSLLPKKRRLKAPERHETELPTKYKKHIGEHSAHPGTRLGNRAVLLAAE